MKALQPISISRFFSSKKLALLTLLLACISLFLSPSAHAVSGGDFRPGRIIDDAVFYNNTSMSVPDIQRFLDSRMPVCDEWGAQPYSGTTRASYARSRGVLVPFTCLNGYYENPSTHENNLTKVDGQKAAIPSGAISAAQIIFDVSQQFRINPQSLIVLLEKEQALVQDDWAWPIQYRSATGYGCPDTAACDSQYYGFYNQVYNAARQFRLYNSNPNSYNYISGANNYIQYNPNASCGGTNIYIENPATAGLYNYTPYQPNQAALNNLYGSGDGCSAYGNRNFWRLFNDWFGSTTGPDYAWSIESLAYSNGDNLVSTGQTETITLRVKNIGRVPWYNHGNHPIRLGTWEPANRQSSLFGTNRLATLQENSVQPNGIGTFVFSVTPNSIGTFAESLNLVAENHTWMAWPGLRPTIQVTSAYQWQIQSVIYENGTGVMEPGAQQLITVIARNTGSATWSKTGPNPVRLGTWVPDRQSAVSATWLSKSRVTDMNEASVEPGQTAGFQFYATMPASGNFYERLNLVAENREWLNDTGLTLYLHGKTYAWQQVWHSHSTGAANIPKNTDFSLTVRVRNTGEMTWRRDGPFPIRLATVAPQDRGSALYTSGWIRDTRPALIQEATVEPGQEGTFVFPARTPSTTGARHERFSLVAEGVSWFNDPGLSIYVNVID